MDKCASMVFMPIPKPDIEGIKKFKAYRDKGLKYSEIEILMGKKARTLTRWNKYIQTKKSVMDKLSTGRRLTLDK